MAHVRLEIKYFNSFVLKKQAKHNAKWLEFSPYPKKMELTSLQSFNYNFTGLENLNDTSDTTKLYDKWDYGNLDLDCRFPSFYSIVGFTGYEDWHGYPAYNTSTFNTTAPNCALPYDSWYIEEARIKGGYNNTATDYGARAYLQNDEQNKSTHRFSSMIYSGVYNTRTGINDTNVFSVAEDITKTAEPAYGSLEKFFAEDTNLTIYQENKISRALIDKDQIYTTEGGTTTLPPGTVMGQITPYAGEYGISTNPESFSYFGFRKYTTDKNRNVVIRLSRDGISEISQYGMFDYFRDKLRSLSPERYRARFVLPLTYVSSGYWALDTSNATYKLISNYITPGSSIKDNATGKTDVITDVNNFSSTSFRVRLATSSFYSSPAATGPFEISCYLKDKAIGGYDENSELYTLSLQRDIKVTYPPQGTYTAAADIEDAKYYTLTFDESSQGWTSFFSYKPDQIYSLKGNFYTTKGDSIYEHYSDTASRGNFYSTQGEMSIEFVFNAQPSIQKNFKTISYEGSNGWEATSVLSDATGFDNINGSYSNNIYKDTIKPIKSYDEGSYMDDGVKSYIGFVRKENKYSSNIRSNNRVMPGQVIIDANGENVSGIKAYYTTVKFKIDATTDPGGEKELFSVSTNFVVSSN